MKDEAPEARAARVVRNMGTPPSAAAALETALTAVFMLEKRIAELENRKSFEYCGTWDAETVYQADDFVTFGGSMWHTDQRTRGVRPGTGQDNPWQLCVKHGRDAR